MESIKSSTGTKWVKSVFSYDLATIPYLFHDGGPYHIETSSVICIANQWTGFYIIGVSVMKELKHF